MLNINYDLTKKENIGELGLDDNDWNSIADISKKAVQKLESWKEDGTADFLNTPTNDELIKIENLAKEYEGKVNDVIVLGIGGSALGLKCLERALMKPYYQLDNPEKRLFVLDNVDPEQINSVFNLVDWDKTLVIIISKSGRTLETGSQFFLVKQKLESLYSKEWKEHVVIITDEKNGSLRELVNKENISSLTIPPKLGGRFSVLSSVGLFPASVLGIDIHNVCKGAADFGKSCLLSDFEKNPALKWAGLNHLFVEKRNMSISVIMSYSYRLELLSDWYLQLWGESLGKEGKGSTPVKAVGTTDQHSQLQLYMQGPNDKLFTFIGLDKYFEGETIDSVSEGFEYIKGKTMSDVMIAEREATARALGEAGKPSVLLELSSDNLAYSLGESFMMFESATALTGAMWDINPFDQPGVERGKVLAKEILNK